MPPPQRHLTVCELEAGFGGELPDLHRAGFRWIVLRRDGKRPLGILARALLQANNRCAGLPFWSEICIHETAAGQFAAGVSHAAPGATGPAWSENWLSSSPEAVRTAFYTHDPLVAVPSESMAGDARAIQRFQGAWAGLLAAMFGMPS